MIALLYKRSLLNIMKNDALFPSCCVDKLIHLMNLCTWIPPSMIIFSIDQIVERVEPQVHGQNPRIAWERWLQLWRRHLRWYLPKIQSVSYTFSKCWSSISEYDCLDMINEILHGIAKKLDEIYQILDDSDLNSFYTATTFYFNFFFKPLGSQTFGSCWPSECHVFV